MTTASAQSDATIVAGAGYVGGLVCDSLHAKGRDVRGVKRSYQDVDWKQFNLDLSTDALCPIFVGAERVDVVYCVAAKSRDEAIYRSAYVTGLKRLLQAAPAIRRLVFVSSTAVYGQTDGSLVDENSATDDSRFNARILLEAEALARDSHAEASTSLRLSGIYGPTRDRMIRMVRDDSAYMAKPSHHTNRIHREDCARAILHLLSMQRTPARIYIGTDQESATWNDVVTWMSDEHGKVSPAETKDLGRGLGKRCDAALLRSHGFEFKYPTFREGYRAVMVGMHSE